MRARSAARYRISLIAAGHASASTQICMRCSAPRRFALARPLVRALVWMGALAVQPLCLRLQRATDLQLLACDANLLQLPQNLLRHPFGQIDEAVVVPDHDAADELAVDAGFVGD